MNDPESPNPESTPGPRSEPEQEVTPTPEVPELVTRVIASFPNAKPYQRNSDCPSAQVPADHLLQLMEKLRGESEFAFDMLCSHTVVDRLAEGVFELVYHLYSTEKRKHLMVSTSVPRDNPLAPTVSSVWSIAEWQEREAYDLFGILYDNHPDLRRVFLEDDWKGFPLRKDYEDDFMLSMESEENDS